MHQFCIYFKDTVAQSNILSQDQVSSENKLIAIEYIYKLAEIILVCLTKAQSYSNFTKSSNHPYKNIQLTI